MRARVLAVLAVACLVLASAAVAVAAPPKAKNFKAKLRGAQEVPAVTTKAVGQATLKLRKGKLLYTLAASNIAEVTAAHVHCGARDVNGPVVATLYAGDTISPRGRFARGTVAVTPVAASAECPGGVADLDDLLAKMRSGQAYVNVHTTAHLGGEIRGQLRVAGPKR